MVAEAQLNLTEIIVLRTGYYWLNYKNYYSKDWALSTTTTKKIIAAIIVLKIEHYWQITKFTVLKTEH